MRSATKGTDGSRELIHVTSRTLVVEVGSAAFTVTENDALIFRSDRRHAYHNDQSHPTRYTSAGPSSTQADMTTAIPYNGADRHRVALDRQVCASLKLASVSGRLVDR